jgi:hypothetical protein
VLAVAAAGKRVSDVAPKLAAAVEPFGVNLVEGVMSHQMKQFVIDGNKVRLDSAPVTNMYLSVLLPQQLTCLADR